MSKFDKRVKYCGKRIGESPTVLKAGDTAIMDSAGLVQLDGKEEWRHRGDLSYTNLWAFGWHDLGKDWVEIE
tara:strand:- start:341 stop:556 length:216 start_codon:yes stop_codon:yes gene_type:complete